MTRDSSDENCSVGVERDSQEPKQYDAKPKLGETEQGYPHE